MNSAAVKEKVRAAAMLRRSSLFRALPAAAIARLAAGSTTLAVPPGELLFRCGEPCAGLYTVLSGRIANSVGVASGPNKVIDLIGPGGHIGLASAVLGANQIVTAEALTDSTLMLTPQSALLECGAAVAELWPQLAAALSRQVCGLITDVAAFSLSSGRERVAHYLLEMTSAQGTRQHPVTLPAKKSIIASRLNLTPEYFSRMLHEFIVEGTIAVNGRHITVLDATRLRVSPH